MKCFFRISRPYHCDLVHGVNLGQSVYELSVMRDAEWHIYELVDRPSLVQLMACRLLSANHLLKPMRLITN